MAADLEADQLERLRVRFTLEAFTRRAVATKLHEQWLTANMAEQADRVDRLETIMGQGDYIQAQRHLITPVERDRVRDILETIPNGLRAHLDELQHRLGWQIALGLGAENRRRLAEVRCMILDAVERLDQLQIYETRRLIVDAEHALSFMANRRTEKERPSRREMDLDPNLRERANAVASELRRIAAGLREAAT